MNKNKNYILIYILLNLLALLFTNKFTIIIPPIILMLYLLYLYSDEIKKFDFNSLFNDPFTQDYIFKAFSFALLGQFILNLIMSKVFHLTIHTLSQTVMFIPIIPVLAVFFSPIVEELIFRRIIFGWLDSKINFWLAALISSIIFAAGHGSLVGMLGYICVGMVFCWIYKKTGNIAISMVAHGYINLIVVISSSLAIHMK